MGVEDGDVVELYVEALAFFGNQVVELGDHDWELSTPCADWNVAQVVAHVVVGESQVKAIVSGATVGSTIDADVSILGTGPMAAWRGTALAAIEAAREPGMLDKFFPHPSGELAGRALLGFRISDNLVHGWDIATAQGRSIELPDHLAAWSLEFWMPVAMTLTETGFYAPPVTPPDGATTGERLLALLGRAA